MILYSLIISAGLSRRMGKFKPLLNFNGRPVISNIIDKLQRVSDKTIIVTGYKEEDVREAVTNGLHYSDLYDKITFVFNPDFESGMFTSLKRGIEAAENCDWLLYHFVDQPHLPENFYSRFINEIEDTYDWIQPSYCGSKGHPLLIKQNVFDLILSENDDSTLRKIANREEIKKKIWNCGFREVLEDMDTAADYERLKM